MMTLSKLSRIFLVILDVALLAFIISDIIRGYSPVEKGVFWFGAGVEVALGYLTFLVWMRSTLGPAYLRYRIIAIILILLGIFLPTIVYFSNNNFLAPAETTERFYLVSALSLLIYSSFIIKRYRETHRKH
jgi:hypothetical protein